jgi:putative ABC transport system permease protein
MAIAVLERRSEIGLRRALGANRRNIAGQFLTEALMLATIGGVTGIAAGAAITAAWANYRGWATTLPPTTLATGLAAAITVGALAGLYPALRAAQLSPTEALRSV